MGEAIEQRRLQLGNSSVHDGTLAEGAHGPRFIDCDVRGRVAERRFWLERRLCEVHASRGFSRPRMNSNVGDAVLDDNSAETAVAQVAY